MYFGKTAVKRQRPLRVNGLGRGPNVAQKTRVFLNELNCNQQNRMRIEILIGGIKVKTLIDFYAERSVLNVNIFRKFKRYQPKPLLNDVILSTATGELPVFGRFEIPYLFMGSTFQQDFLIADRIREEVIFGKDAIFDLGLVIDSAGRAVFRKVSKVPSSVFKEDDEKFEEPATVATLEKVSVPVNGESMVQCEASHNSGSPGDSNSVIESSSILPAENVIECCYPSNVCKETSISSGNLSSKSVFGPRKSVVVEIEKKPELFNSPSHTLSDSYACSFGIDVVNVGESNVQHSSENIFPRSDFKNLNEAEVKHLNELRNEHSDVFCQSESDLDTHPSNFHVTYAVNDVLESKQILKNPYDPDETPLKSVFLPSKTDPPDKNFEFSEMSIRENPSVSIPLTPNFPFDPGDSSTKTYTTT